MFETRLKSINSGRFRHSLPIADSSVMVDLYRHLDRKTGFPDSA
jgi:hypothetical protein